MEITNIRCVAGTSQVPETEFLTSGYEVRVMDMMRNETIRSRYVILKGFVVKLKCMIMALCVYMERMNAEMVTKREYF